jgi:hypothetical protein
MAVSTLLSLTKLITDHGLPGSRPLTGFKSYTFGVSCIRYWEREQEKVLLQCRLWPPRPRHVDRLAPCSRPQSTNISRSTTCLIISSRSRHLRGHAQRIAVARGALGTSPFLKAPQLPNTSSNTTCSVISTPLERSARVSRPQRRPTSSMPPHTLPTTALLPTQSMLPPSLRLIQTHLSSRPQSCLLVSLASHLRSRSRD